MDDGTPSQTETATAGSATQATAAPPTPTPPLPPPRTLRQRIDDHPAALFVGIAIAAATATLGIVLPIVQVAQDLLLAVLVDKGSRSSWPEEPTRRAV